MGFGTPIHVYGVTADPSSKLVMAVFMPYGLTTPAGLTLIGGAFPDPVVVPTGQAYFVFGMVETFDGSGSYQCQGWIDDAVALPDSPANYPYMVAVKQVASGTDLAVYDDCLIEFATGADVRAEQQVPDTFMSGMLRDSTWGAAAVSLDAATLATLTDVQQVVITPILASAANPRISTRKLATLVQGTASSDLVTLTDATGAAIDLSAKDLRMVVATVNDDGDEDDRTDDTIAALYKYETGNGLTVQGDDDNQILIEHDAANTTDAGHFRYWIYDVTDPDQPLPRLKGTFDVEPAATDV
jgi:hypothetical protein